MYRVFWYGFNGGEHIEFVDSMTKACKIALSHRYGFACIKDTNGSIVFDGICETHKCELIFYKKYNQE